ncbi:MAG: putative capsid protein [Cressdnaviricota sp.]|nr:MAG: putative capsid protein [Cressdnaviricota sp.]
MGGKGSGRKRTKGRGPKRRRGRKLKMSDYKIRKPLSLKQHQFCERVIGDTIQIGNEAGQGIAPYFTKAFKFSDIPQCQQYSSIFEQYRMDKVVVTFRYKGIALPALLNAGPAMINELNPVLYWKVDHNDLNTNTLAYMKQSTRTKSHVFTNSNSEFTISLKPASQKLLIRQLQPTVTSTNIPAWKQWIDADGQAGPGSSVEHLGLKAYCLGYASLDFKPGYLDVEYKYYFSMKCNE